MAIFVNSINMESMSAIRLRLKNLIKEHNTNYNDLCIKSGLARSSLKTIFYGKTKSTTVHTLSLLCGGLGITLYDFFNDEIFKSVNGDDDCEE